MNNIIDRLEAANPFPSERPAASPSRTAEQLFADITTTDTADNTESPNLDRAAIALNDRRSRRGLRGRVLGIAAVITVAVLMTVAAVFSGPGSSDAQAALTQAAQAVAGFDSGQADVRITGTGLPGELQTLDAVSTYTYNGDDYRFIETGERADGTHYIFELRRVGSRFYWSSPGTPGAFVHGPIDEFGYFESLESTFSFNPKAAGLDALTPVFDSADNVTQRAEGSLSIYAATIPQQALAEVNRAQLPPGLAIIAGPSARQLPSEIALEAVVDDGVLRKLVVTIDGDTATGPMTAQITTTLSGLGSTSVVTAPGDDVLLDIATGLSAAELEAMGVDQSTLARATRFETVSADLATRRPRLCIEFGGSMFEGALQPDQMTTLIAEFEEVANCYQQAGEDAAADVMQEGADGWRLTLDEALALDDVGSRRPGLCEEHKPYSTDGDLQQAFVDSRAAYSQCLAEAGETRAAAAVKAHTDYNPVVFLDE